MPDERSLVVKNGDATLFSGCRIKIIGRSTMSCVPDVWILDITDADSSDTHSARFANRIIVTGENGSVIGYGKPTSVYVHSVGGKEITSITLEDGADLWNAFVSVTMQGGSTYRESADLILLHSSCSSVISSFPNDSTILIRGQTFHGGSVQCLNSIASSLGCRLWSIRDTVRFTRLDEQTDIRTVTQDDISNDIGMIDSNCYVIDTNVIGIQVGSSVKIESDDLKGTYLVVARSVSADSIEGQWGSSIIVIDPKTFSGRWEGYF